MNIDEIYKGAAPEQMKLAHEIHNETVKSEAEWIAELRSIGIKAAHWNNGYVDRVNNVLAPHDLFFNDGVAVGDLIAIGNPPEWYSPNKIAHRVVRVVDTLPSLGYRKVDRWVFAPMPGEPDIRESIDKQSWFGSLVAAQNARELADKGVAK